MINKIKTNKLVILILILDHLQYNIEQLIKELFRFIIKSVKLSKFLHTTI